MDSSGRPGDRADDEPEDRPSDDVRCARALRQKARLLQYALRLARIDSTRARLKQVEARRALLEETLQLVSPDAQEALLEHLERLVDYPPSDLPAWCSSDWEKEYASATLERREVRGARRPDLRG